MFLEITNQQRVDNILIQAAQSNDIEKIIYALKEGANIEIKSDYDFTPLHYAARNGHSLILKKLIAAGANIEALNKNGNTPLHLSSYNGQSNTTLALIHRGANLYAQNHDGDTPLHSATRKNHNVILNILIVSGAGLEIQNKDGSTSLHLACLNNCFASVNTLLRLNANLFAITHKGETPIELAKMKNHCLVVNLVTNFAYKNSFIKNINTSINKLIESIVNKENDISIILSDYQTQHVIDYEIERSIRTLDGFNKNENYFEHGKKINLIAILLPSNLPLYSLIIFAIIPSFLSTSTYLRPNGLLQEHNIISRIGNILNLNKILPSLSIINGSYNNFSLFIKEADLIIFTGKPSNADKIINQMQDNSMLIINGAGHNPLVITESANINEAVEGALIAKSFNSGQDCAGPDAILVHQDIADEFTKQFTTKFSELKIGEFKDLDTIIAPISRFSELQKFATIFFNNSKDIISGGTIDFKNSIVLPTVIVRGIEHYPNYKEMFGPVAFIHPYKNDQDLAYYFQDTEGQYNTNRMYVTVYGHSSYLACRDDFENPGLSSNVGIILYNKTIHDVEIGYNPYGGYSLAASSIIKKSPNGLQKIAMPILIPKVITEYLINNNELPAKIKNISKIIVKNTKLDLIIAAFQDLVERVFGDDVSFCFIFGSAAKGNLQISGPDISDLDTFVCLKNLNKLSILDYIKKLATLHCKFGLKVDKIFPAEIMSLRELQDIIKNLSSLEVSINKIIAGENFNKLFWMHALTDKKIGFMGDGILMSSLIKKSYPHIYNWKNLILEELKIMEVIPKYLQEKFIGLSKEKILKKFLKYSPHLVIHLGLNYDETKGYLSLNDDTESDKKLVIGESKEQNFLLFSEPLEVINQEHNIINEDMKTVGNIFNVNRE